MAAVRSPASFRDTSGHVYEHAGRIIRTVSAKAAPRYTFVRDGQHLRRWMDDGWVVGTTEVGRESAGLSGDVDAELVLEHERIPFVSHPYEWSFGALKRAALLHLDLQRDALDHGVELSDATAYNVQFVGARPIFIDVLSFRPYVEGAYWTGQRQFSQQFLNPLLLRALLGVPHNAWCRGALEGIPTTELNQLLRTGQKWSWHVFSHVTLPARMETKLSAGALRAGPSKSQLRPLPRAAYAGLLAQLRGWIAGLAPRGQTQTTWSDYDTGHTYAGDEFAKKCAFVEAFVRDSRPSQLWDLGCNTGEFSELALGAGAGMTIGFESDHGALERAFERAATKGLAFLPLHMDAASPSPDQGWNQQERSGLQRRAAADAVLALAFEHHLAIGRNIPLDLLLDWLVSLAPRGVVEFVPKTDPTVQRMLALREDVFDEYGEDAFVRLLATRARIVRSEVVSATGRRLFAYERDSAA